MKSSLLKTLQIGNIVAVIVTIIINGLANIIPLGGKYTGELSDNIPNLFVPTGLTFAIWGVIYILIILFTLYLAKDLFKKEKTSTPFLEKISFFFIISCIANIIWIFLWHYEQILLSFFAMILLFLSLFVMYQRLHIGIENVSRSEKLFVHVPISVYLGWITVATIANVTAVLVTIGWDGFGISEELWTIIVLIIVSMITMSLLFKRRDYFFSFVIIWALLGIYLKRITYDPIYGVQMNIAYTALVLILIVLAILGLLLYKDHSKKKLKK